MLAVSCGHWALQDTTITYLVGRVDGKELVGHRIVVEVCETNGEWRECDEIALSTSDPCSAIQRSLTGLKRRTRYLVRAALQEEADGNLGEYSEAVAARTAQARVARRPLETDDEYDQARRRHQDSYLERFLAMVAELRAQPEIVVWRFRVFPPLADDAIDEICREFYPCGIHESIRSFYKQTNGLQLRWILRSDNAFDPTVHVEETAEQAPKSVDEVDWEPADIYVGEGAVSIVPLREIFSRDWGFGFDVEEDRKFGGKTFVESDFLESLRCFDGFYYYHSPVFVCATQEADPPCIKGDDHGADFSADMVFDFHSYLEYVLASYALCGRTYYAVGWFSGMNGTRVCTSREYWAKRPYDLREIVDTKGSVVPQYE